MPKPQIRVTDPNETQEAFNRPAAGENPRERLLAGVPMTERRLRLAGISTAVLEGGDGPPIVLLHGPGQYAAKWLRVIPNLITTHRVVAPDLPAHGASEAFDGPPDLNRMLEQRDVKTMVQGPTAAICDECVAICEDTISSRQGLLQRFLERRR